MAWWTQNNAQLQQSLRSRDDLTEENDLVSAGAMYGPTANQVKKAFPDLMSDVALTDTPWAAGSDKAQGIGPNNTYWILDPRSLNRGIWVLDSTSEEAAKNAQAANAPTQYGFYRRVSETLPPIADIKNAKLTFQKGFTEAYYKLYPDQDPRPKNKPQTTQRPVKTYELFGQLNGSNVLATDVLSGGDGDYVLMDGASLVVGDAPEDGFGLAGSPGKWADYYPGQSPAAFGLDADKAVLMWNGERGVVLPGSLLKDIYGPQWRVTIYG